MAASIPRTKAVNRWHRYAGISAAGLLVYLVITGVPLQFSAELDLGKTYVSSNWILTSYGIAAPEHVVVSGPIVQVDDQLFFLPTLDLVIVLVLLVDVGEEQIAGLP